jgi:penicillin-binding protein 2
VTAFTSNELRRRAQGARLVLVAAFLVLGGAFFKAQVLESSEYRSTSESNRVRPIPLPAPRGELRDRNGLLIAENTPGYTIRLWADRVDSLRAIVGRIDALTPLDTVDLEKVVARWRAAPYQPVQVFTSGEFRIVSILEEHRAQLPGLVIQAEPRRFYPDSTALGHVAGYVGDISERELAGDRFPGAQMGTIVGKNGLEFEYDQTLRGTPGVRFVEVTAFGRTVRDGGTDRFVKPQVGQTITTTLDLPLQRFVDSMWRNNEFLATRSGALLAMRPTGEILAYYSYPTFDPNAFIGGISQARYNVYNDPKRSALFDRVIQGGYPPASPFKLAVAAIGLKRGLVTMSTRMPVPCTGGYQFGSRRFRCWKPEGHGAVTLADAIKVSCDVYFYQLGLKLGAENLLAGGAALGFDARSGIDLEREQSSRWAHDVEDYVTVKRFGTFTDGQILNLSIGQGANVQSLVNMTTFYAALATDGIKRSPFLVQRRADGPVFDLGLTPEQLADLRLALADVVLTGTAGASGGRDLLVAGKTGTGQMPRGQGDAGWFIGFAPYDAPRIVIGMLVEEGQHGSTVAPYVVKAMRRFLIGPDSTVLAAPVDVPITENLVEPRPVDQDPAGAIALPPVLPAPPPDSVPR